MLTIKNYQTIENRKIDLARSRSITIMTVVERNDFYIIELKLHNPDLIAKNQSAYIRIWRTKSLLSTHAEVHQEAYKIEWDISSHISKINESYLTPKDFSTIDTFLNHIKEAYEIRHPHLIKTSDADINGINTFPITSNSSIVYNSHVNHLSYLIP